MTTGDIVNIIIPVVCICIGAFWGLLLACRR